MNTSLIPRRARLRPDELAGRIIAITGPTRGIGHAVALECARRGATVVLIGRNVKRTGSGACQKSKKPVALKR